MGKFVYSFNENPPDQDRLLGVKGASLAKMTQMGLPVPFGFTVTAQAAVACRPGQRYPDAALTEEILEKLSELERVTGHRFGDRVAPLLLSVRPEGRTLLPCVGQTILDLGCSSAVVEAWAGEPDRAAFARDCYRRLMQDYGQLVLGIESEKFAQILADARARAGVACEAALTDADWAEVLDAYGALVLRESGAPFPEDAQEQLLTVVQSLFCRYAAEEQVRNAERPFYAASTGEADQETASGMAVHVQAMVFGNHNADSCTGIAFTRNPFSGAAGLCGKFLVQAQGEDLRDETRDLRPLPEMQDQFPAAYQELERAAQVLERRAQEMQDIAFTVDDGKLYILQADTAPRTSLASIRAAVDMTREGLITREMAVTRIDTAKIDRLLHPDTGTATEAAEQLLREELRRAGRLQSDRALPVSAAEMDFIDDLNTLIGWADEIRSLKVRTNADNAEEAAQAIRFGAEGIGLCRTEHMFTGQARLLWLQQSLMAGDEVQRREALDALELLQKSDFKEIYRVTEDRPVAIRLLDPSLNLFLPRDAAALQALSEKTGISCARLQAAKEALEESNPTLGRRGCRLAVSYPALAEMQTRAIFEAAVEVSREKDLEIVPEILIPLVSMEEEVAFVKRIIAGIADRCREAYGVELEYRVGAMIEVPRAALIADKIAREADFFSFGTNDLTQMVFGFSRTDADELLEAYRAQQLLNGDPFQTMDRDGVGRLMEMAVRLGRGARSNLRLGLCGEHGGDPSSIAFCHALGLDYVSCTPFRVPSAKIAAAQAAIAAKNKD